MVAMARLMVSVCMCACLVSSFYIPPDMNRTIQDLLQYYKISNKERFNGRPVFSTEPLDADIQNDTEKQVYLGRVLETYEDLINKMMNQLTTPSPQAVSKDQRPAITAIANATAAAAAAGNQAEAAGGQVRDQLKIILKWVTELRTHGYHKQAKVLKGLKDLRHIQMDDLTVQSKALWELPRLYQEASAVIERKQRRRRRRGSKHLRV